MEISKIVAGGLTVGLSLGVTAECHHVGDVERVSVVRAVAVTEGLYLRQPSALTLIRL